MPWAQGDGRDATVSLVSLIIALQPVSASFNPVVSLVERALSMIDTKVAAGAIGAGRLQTGTRVIAGHGRLAAAKARGRLGGRPRSMTPGKLETARQLRNEGKTLKGNGCHA